MVRVPKHATAEEKVVDILGVNIDMSIAEEIHKVFVTMSLSGKKKKKKKAVTIGSIVQSPKKNTMSAYISILVKPLSVGQKGGVMV